MEKLSLTGRNQITVWESSLTTYAQLFTLTPGTKKPRTFLPAKQSYSRTAGIMSQAHMIITVGI